MSNACENIPFVLEGQSCPALLWSLVVHQHPEIETGRGMLATCQENGVPEARGSADHKNNVLIISAGASHMTLDSNSDV